jgi:hypothetical protein
MLPTTEEYLICSESIFINPPPTGKLVEDVMVTDVAVEDIPPTRFIVLLTEANVTSPAAVVYLIGVISLKAPAEKM